MNRDDIAYLDRHVAETGRVELRLIDPGGRVQSGVFDQPGLLQVAIWKNRNRANAYISIQAPKPGPVTNEIRPGVRALGNDDIGHYIRLVFDLDAVRPKGSAAPPLQLEYTREAAENIRRFLSRQGWPLPAVVASGNGHHLIWRLAPIPVTPELSKRLDVVYRGLAAQFGSAAVSFDTTVQNPGRIIRAPGSLNIKVPADPRAVVCELPARWRQVTPGQLDELARVMAVCLGEVDSPPKRNTTHREASAINGAGLPAGKGDYATLDLPGWFEAHGCYIGHIRENRHTVRCPWADEHTTPSLKGGGDTVIFESDGRIWGEFFCHHAHCADRRIGDVLALWGDADRFCRREFRASVTPARVPREVGR